MNLIPTFIRRRIAHRPNLVKIVDNVGWLFIDKLLRMGVGLFVVLRCENPDTDEPIKPRAAFRYRSSGTAWPACR
jgi:hypothetical protein